MKNIRIERPFLAFGATLLASLVAFADDAAILSSPTDVRDLLRDAQAARLPSPNVVTQDLGAAVVEPADASASAWFSAVGEGAAFAFEDPATSDTFLHRFSTKPFDPETGLLYYGYRHYSPALGRWLNRDPVFEVDSKNLFCAFKTFQQRVLIC